MYRTLLSILAYLNDDVVWIVSTCSLISKFSSHLTNSLEIVPSSPITISITITFMFHSFFLVLWPGLGTYLSFLFLLFFLYGPPIQFSPQLAGFLFFLSFFPFFFFLDYHSVLSSVRD